MLSAADQLAAFDILPGAIMVAVDLELVYANPAALDLFAVPDLAALVERATARNHVHVDDVALWAVGRAAVDRGERASATVECRVVRPDGALSVVEWVTLPCSLGGRRAVLDAVDDITELADLRDRSQASERHQHEVVATLAEGVIVVDADGVCRDANPSAARLLGLASVAELIGLAGESMPLVDPSGEPLTRRDHPLWRCLDRGEQVRREVHAIAFPRWIRLMRVSVIPMRDVEQHVVGAVVTFDDVTRDLEAQDRVAKSEERFRKLAAISPVAVCETDATGSCTYVNARWCEFSGSTADEAMGRGWTDAVHPDDRDRFTQEWTQAVTQGDRFRSEFRFLRPDGVSTSVYCETAPIVDDTGGVTGWIASAMDVTAELALREGLRDSEARFRLLVEHSPDVVVRISLNPWRIDYVSPSIVNLTGRVPQDFYADPALLINVIHPDDLVRIADPTSLPSFTDVFDVRVIDGDGAIRTVEARRNILVVAGVAMAVEATIRDITLDVAEQRRLEDLAHRDELTGLPNRRALMSALDGRLAGRQPTSVIFLDLDGFKGVNDRHGHDVGDALLQAFGARLVGIVRDGDFVARLAGDEFVVIALPEHSRTLADRIVHELAQPHVLDSRTVTVGVSAGITNFDWTGSLQQAETLLQQADQAMYEAKRRGKGQVVVNP